MLFPRIATVLSSLLLCSLCSTVAAASFEEYMVAPGEKVEGRAIVDYVNRWWQWGQTMPSGFSPIRDPSGEYCAQGQQGEVWFLAGGYGSSKIKRHCEVPAGKYLFFPVINMLYYAPANVSVSCDQVKRSAALNNDELLNIDVVLDGVHASNPAHSRMASPDCFDLLGLVAKNIDPRVIYPAATDGYWLMLKPLPKGKHHLSFSARYNAESGAYAKMVQDIEYELEVK